MLTYKHHAAKTLLFFTVCFPIISIAVGSGYNYSSIMLLLASIFFLLTEKSKFNISKEARLFIYTLLFYFLSFLILKIIHNEDWSYIDKPSRALLVILIFGALLKSPPSWRTFSFGVNAASILSALIALIYLLEYPNYRAFDGNVPINIFSGYMQIQTGGMITTFAIASFVIFLIELKNEKRLYPLLAFFAFVLASWASLQTGSRGSWVLAPAAIIYAIHKTFNLFRVKVLFFTFLLIIGSVLTLSTNDRVNNRVQQAISDIALYNSGKNNYTSLGIRLNLWKSSIYTFLDSPITGAGKDGRLEQRKELGDKGIIDKRVSRETYHDHNQFLEASSIGGFIGLSALIVIFCVPASVFRKELIHSTAKEKHNFSLVGMVSIILMIGYCLSQAYFNHNSGTIFYLVWTTILIACVTTRKGGNNEL